MKCKCIECKRSYVTTDIYLNNHICPYCMVQNLEGNYDLIMEVVCKAIGGLGYIQGRFANINTITKIVDDYMDEISEIFNKHRKIMSKRKERD